MKIKLMIPVENFRTRSATNNGVVVKSVRGSLIRINIVNAVASIIYVKLYDKATAPTASDTPVYTFAISSAAIGATATHSFVNPIEFYSGIGVRAVTGVLDNDNTAPATLPIIEIGYI